MLTRCHGQQNVKFMMTTIRRQAASCLYGLAPFLSDILNGKLDTVELIEAADTDEEPNVDSVQHIKTDIEDRIHSGLEISARLILRSKPFLTS